MPSTISTPWRMTTKTATACVVLFLLGSILSGCRGKVAQSSGCPEDVAILTSFRSPEGQDVTVYEDGRAFINDGGSCIFALQYFDPDFLENNYVATDSGVFLVTENGTLFPTRNDFTEDFETISTFTDLFIWSVTDTTRYWMSFTLQSPAAPEVSDYVALRKCILNGTCSFLDNRIEPADDPMNPRNHVLRFTSVAPSADMTTAKCSIESTVSFFSKNSDVWFQADCYIESGMPFSLVDFENAYFYERPGPRVVIRGNALAIENKFGAKQNYAQTSGIAVPLKQWFTVKVHFRYSDREDGIIELWQNGSLLISTTGINLPTANSIQNVLEVGVTATQAGCVLLLDNVRISETPF